MGWNSDKTKKATEYTMFGNDMHSAKKYKDLDPSHRSETILVLLSHDSFTTVDGSGLTFTSVSETFPYRGISLHDILHTTPTFTPLPLLNSPHTPEFC